ncbi:hypothetical protein ABW21_db0209153 [Orbilia brochopaga]|nr:hypothetical protein ABW21_db0209153 [Drechslerella brochopaga]
MRHQGSIERASSLANGCFSVYVLRSDDPPIRVYERLNSHFAPIWQHLCLRLWPFRNAFAFCAHPCMSLRGTENLRTMNRASIRIPGQSFCEGSGALVSPELPACHAAETTHWLDYSLVTPYFQYCE